MFEATIFEKVLAILSPMFYIAVLGGIAIRQMKHEQKRWNSGACRLCHSPWIRFDIDSQGGRGYKCACGCYIWISYPVDK